MLVPLVEGELFVARQQQEGAAEDVDSEPEPGVVHLDGRARVGPAVRRGSEWDRR